MIVYLVDDDQGVLKGSSVRAMKAGPIDFLTKPVNEGELLAAISGALDKGRLSAQHVVTHCSVGPLVSG